MTTLGLWLLASAAIAGSDVRGMTVSCPTWGWEWGSDEMVATLDVLRGDGVNWVAIHPYASIGADGSVRWRQAADDPAWLTRPIAEAHARGMKVMVVPHLAYWGSPFSWRGAIRFDDPVARARFFREYQAFVVALAAIVRDADAFVVGSELDGTIDDEAAWRGVISAVRPVYPGPITYASNWDAFERVRFWDAVDVVGVQAYFPLVTEEAPPSTDDLAAGWRAVMARVRALHERTGKQVIFTELGYDAHDRAALEPWASGKPTPSGEALQQAALDAALRAVDQEPAVVGAFLWKWFPGEVAHGDFRMSTPANRSIIRAAWAGR
jgi:hypothetical protein